jgi:acetyl esterase/lipase
MDMRHAIMTLTVLLLAGVAPAEQRDSDLNPPFEIPLDVEMRADLVYASPGGRDLHLDLFLPRSQDGLAPAVVYLHGGGWRGGNKRQFWRQAAHMATRGFVGVSVEYRLSGEAKFPAPVEDAKAAVRWLRANASELGIDPNRIGAAGGSAGGHLAAMLGTTPGVQKFEGDGGHAEFSSRVQAVAGINPALDFSGVGAREADQRALYEFLGSSYQENLDLWAEASPVRHVGEDSAPFLFLHGTEDRTVPYRRSVEMRDKLEAAGVRAEIFTADGAHGFFNGPPWYQPSLEAMEEFFVDTLGAPSSDQR